MALNKSGGGPLQSLVRSYSQLFSTTTYTYQQSIAENRLVKIATLNPSAANPARSSEFAYDGFMRRTRIVEKQGVQVVADRRFIWNGVNIVEERDAANSVLKRFYGTGVQVVSGAQAGNRFYQRDHLGSIRSVTDENGLVVASYDYDLWGKQIKLSGTFDADFGYAGYFEHAPSGLALTLFRGYSPILGRWISRDPLRELGGMNLFSYAGNDPMNNYDEYGLTANDIQLILNCLREKMTGTGVSIPNNFAEVSFFDAYWNYFWHNKSTLGAANPGGDTIFLNPQFWQELGENRFNQLVDVIAHESLHINQDPNKASHHRDQDDPQHTGDNPDQKNKMNQAVDDCKKRGKQCR